MKDNQHIFFHKWDKSKMKHLMKSIRNVLSMNSLQFYMPLFSLYFYIHNTPLSHKIIDLQRKYYVSEINQIIKEKYYNSNFILKGKIFDSGKNTNKDADIFCKVIPILDPIHCINNNYNLLHKNNYHLPSCYNYNAFNKINDMNNSSYIDVFCSYLFSQLVIQKTLPSFAIFYGSVNGIGNYKYDITEEYEDLRIDKCFNQNIGKTFQLDMYVSSDEDTDSDSSCDSNPEDDYIIRLEKIPLQLLFIEKLEGTLEDYLLDDNFDQEVLLSCLFQISFALLYLQKHYQFTHNDLHINNIMYSYTDTKYLYYKLNNKYYKVPTYGKIFKIIDFGRSIFTFKNKVYMNDVFSKNSEAWGQYQYPSQVSFLKTNTESNQIKPNYNFDLCRLSMTILDESEDKIKGSLLDLFIHMSTDRYGNNFCQMEDDFSLYIKISKDSIHSLPKDILNNEIFKKYKVIKKKFPHKSYYKI